MVVQATCPKCKKVIYGYQWAKTKSNKNWLMNEAGDWHSCGDQVGKKSKKSNSIWDMSPSGPRYFSCGKCGGNCKDTGFYDYYCEKCKMYPDTTHRRQDETGNGPTDESVRPMMITNYNEVVEEYRKHNDDKPVNWMHMQDDGTIKNGYKLTEELIKWFKEGGEQIIKEIKEKTWHKEKVLNA